MGAPVAEVTQTTVRIDKELLKAVKRAALERESDQTEAINTGLRLWLGATIPTDSALEGLSSRQRKLVLDIIDVLRAGNPRYEKMLRAAVDVMAGVEVRES